MQSPCRKTSLVDPTEEFTIECTCPGLLQSFALFLRQVTNGANQRRLLMGCVFLEHVSIILNFFGLDETFLQCSHPCNPWLKEDGAMSITRIGEFQANPELTQALHDFLLSIIPIIKSSQGCESVTLYQSQADPTKFTMLEVWDNIESHQASVKNIPPEMLAKIRPLLASAPSGWYFDLVSAG